MHAMDRTISAARTAHHQADLGFADFFEEHRDRLFRAAWLVCRDRHEAEEIAQDAFLRVWQRWITVRTLEDPAAYLFRTALNVTRNRRRHAALAVRRFAHLAPPHDDVAAVDAVDARDAVVRALGTLTARQRAAIVLTDLLDMTSEDAARALGVRPPTVRVLAARARAALRKEMGENDA
jgi:RNA polymerase sigma factor (sigma-70 family)